MRWIILKNRQKIGIVILGIGIILLLGEYNPSILAFINKYLTLPVVLILTGLFITLSK